MRHPRTALISCVYRGAGHMDFMITEPASRIKGLQLMMKSEKGEHLQMDILQLQKVTPPWLPSLRPSNTHAACCMYELLSGTAPAVYAVTMPS